MASSPLSGVDWGVLAVGVIPLPDPAAALRLGIAGPARVGLHRFVAPTPLTSLTDLSDAALKGMCDRNGWLLGAPAERTMREVAARGAAVSWTDDALDAHAFRNNPPSAEVRPAQPLVAAAR